MIKIEYSNDIILRHIKYFEENIACNLLSSNSYKAVKGYCKNNKLPKRHKRFLCLCKNKWSTIAIGKPKELEEVYLLIKKRYPEVIDKIKDKEYKELLINIFGYKSFCSKNVFYFLNEAAKNIANKTRYCIEVRDEIIKLLRDEFPEHNNKIQDLRFIRTKSELENKINKLDFLVFTFNNIQGKEIFKDFWNDYIFVLMSGIKVCPYCNRQYISPVYSDNGKVRGDIDHFLPKSIYPYFSMSLYNLIPVCKSCNQSLKMDKEFDFNNINPYADNLDDYFRFKADLQTMKINIETFEKVKGISEHIKTFKLEHLYNYHQNQVKELVEKRIIYPDSYIDDLFENYKDFFVSEEHIKQLIIGFSYDKKGLNDEAFHKLRRDIANQLNFLNNQDTKQMSKLKEILKRKKS